MLMLSLPKRLLFIFVLFLQPLHGLSIPSSLECERKLMDDYQGSSAGYLNVDEFFYQDRTKPNWQETYAKQTVSSYMRQLGCPKSIHEERILDEKVSCSQIGAAHLCVVEAQLGFFVVSKDQVDGAYVVFHRWD